MDDVRDGIGDKLNIGKILDLEEEDFVMVDEKRRHKTVKVWFIYLFLFYEHWIDNEILKSIGIMSDNHFLKRGCTVDEHKIVLFLNWTFNCCFIFWSEYDLKIIK